MLPLINFLGKQSGDLFKLDTKNKTPKQNIVDIIQGLYLKKQHETSPTSKNVSTEFKPMLRGMQRSGSDSRRLSYLNALVTLLCKEDRSGLGFGADELMTWWVLLTLVWSSIGLLDRLVLEQHSYLTRLWNFCFVVIMK